MFFKKKISKSQNFLELTPIRKVEFEQKDDERIVLLIPRFKSAISQKYLIPKKKGKFIKATLDPLGSQSFLLANGERTIFEIANLLQEKSPEEIQDAYMRVSKFFATLYSSHLIEFKELIHKDLKIMEINDVKN